MYIYYKHIRVVLVYLSQFQKNKAGERGSCLNKMNLNKSQENIYCCQSRLMNYRLSFPKMSQGECHLIPLAISLSYQAVTVRLAGCHCSFL